MNVRRKLADVQKIPAVRTILFVLGLLLMLLSPLVGALPGPGGIIVFAGGLTLALRYSDWAKRRYVKFKRDHPRKGRWADWGLRRRSAARREERRKAQAQQEAESAALQAEAAVGESGAAIEPAGCAISRVQDD
jgi:hypothetical protein